MTYAPCRYFVPSSLLASQTTERAARTRKRTVNQQPLTYKHLLDKQTYHVETQSLNAQTAANRATALRAFLRTHSLDAEDVIGPEMRMHWPECLEKFLRGLQEQGKSPRSISNTKAALMPWRQMVVEDDNARAVDAGKPTLFQAQLRALIGDRPITFVARQTNVPYDMLLGWVNGKVPRTTSALHIARVERFFGIETGSLSSIAGVSHAPRLRPENIGALAPNAYRDSLAERTKHHYWFKPAEDSPLRKQWYDFMRYKTAASHSLERSKKGRWRIAPLPIEVERPTNWFIFLNGAEVPSAYAVWAKVAGYLGWLALPPEKGGKGIAAECLQTIAWFVVPELVEEHLDWKKERSGMYSSSFPEFIGWAKSLLRPGVGYFPQNPWLRDTLPEEFRLGNWEAMCAAQFKHLDNLLESRLGEVEVARDSFAPIADVLDLPEPMEAVVDMIQRLRADRPVGNPLSEAIWARDLVMLKMMISNPLRRRMYAHLKWRPDNAGNLYQKLDGSWWIKWKTKYFKNAKGAAGDMDYDSPVHESAWKDTARVKIVVASVMQPVGRYGPPGPCRLLRRAHALG